MITKTKQKCGICHKSGHNRRTCKKLQQKTKKKIKKLVTHIAIVLDNSGSMRSHTSRTQLAFNEVLNSIQEQAKEQDLRVSYYTFGQYVRRKFFESPANSISKMNNYYPDEPRTALFEAIQTAVRDFEGLPDSKNVNSSFLIQIITDGLENKHNVSQPAIMKLIRNCQDTDRWTFAISCPEQHRSSISSKLGIFEGNIQGWDPYSKYGMDTVKRGHSIGVSTYLASRISGQTATKKFFAEVNIGRQGINTVKKGLKAESKTRFRRLKVDKARGIKDFIESKNLKFQKGRVFYALSKPEIVQSFKEIVLQKRSDPKVLYGGAQVRAKLGIPHGQEGKVSPGNLGEWIVWIQSTSSNRKLLAKMEVLYDTSATVKNGRN